MTLTNQERATRCQEALAAYGEYDAYTILVDFLADAMHFCEQSGHSFEDAFNTALMHFDAEVNGDDIQDDFDRHETSNERNQP